MQTVQRTDQTLYFAVSDLSDLVLHCLPMSHKKALGFKWVKKSFKKLNTFVPTWKIIMMTTKNLSSMAPIKKALN